MNRARLMFTTCCAIAGALPGMAFAQAYPQKPIRIIVAFAPGGGSDLLARIVAQKLNEAWGQPVVVENKTGAEGNIGMERAAKSTPDGYTLAVMPAGNAVVNPHLFKSLPYDPFKDFAPVTLMANVENVLVVNAELPARNVQELVALAKTKPKGFSYASPGVGSLAHIAGELMKSMTGIDMQHVPYKGIAAAMNDVISGQITLMFSQLSSSLPFIKSGRLRALGVASPRRSQALPDAPTVAEQNLPGFAAVSWYALVAPAGTPKPVINQLQREVSRILREPSIKERLAALGADPVGGTAEELAALMKTESARWSKVIAGAGIKAE